jgi:lipoprotein-anchoring transpeptidase ErfK/SrfK
MLAKLLVLSAIGFTLGFTTRHALGLQDSAPAIVISVPDQRLIVLQNGLRVADYPVSTSRYGLGDRFNSYATPAGWMEVAQKIGGGAPLGAVFKDRRATGEVLRPNAQGRDPIVTRILWLRGLESGTRNAFARNIYIHGTPVENLIGRPASFGCIRMRSKDVIDLFNRVGVGVKVDISNRPVRNAVSELGSSSARSIAAS